MRSLLAVVGVVLSAPQVRAEPSPDAKAIAAVIDAQFVSFRTPDLAAAIYARGAMVAMTGGVASPQVDKLDAKNAKWTIFGPATIGKHKLRDVRIALAQDGKAAWASFAATASVQGLVKSGNADYRATELLVHTETGWQVQAAAWSVGIARATLTKAAKDSSLADLETVFDQNIGEPDVLAAVKSFVGSGFDANATARADVVAVGPASGEVAVGGKAIVAALATTRLALDGSTWAFTTGTAACATANVKLTRDGATMPARMFVVFEKDANGAWSPVLLHLAAAAKNT